MALTGTLIISLLLTSMLFVVIPCSKAAFQGPQVQWSRTYPASTLPMAKVIQALDGGYAIVGNNATNDYQGVKIGNRAMVIKTDSYGKVQWAKTYGSEFGVGANVLTIVQTRDSGFAICSYSASGWLLKTDAQGNVQWNTTVSVVLAGETDFTSLAETNDLGFVLTYEGWFGNMSGGYTGLLKTDANGHTLWSTIYSTETSAANAGAYARAAYQTAEGEYVLIGSWRSNAWFAKTDSTGKLELNKTYEYGAFNSISNSTDGGYILCGSDGFGVGLLTKVDSQGNVLWNQFFSGRSGKGCFLDSVNTTSDRGYVVAGFLYDSALNYGFLARTDSSGNIMWNTTYDGRINEGASSIIITDDNGFAIVGSRDNSIWFDKIALETVSASNESSPFLTSLIVAVAVTVIVIIVGIAFQVYFKSRKR